MSARGRRARPRSSRGAGQAHGAATRCPATVGAHPECRRGDPHHCAAAPASGAARSAACLPAPHSRSQQVGARRRAAGGEARLHGTPRAGLRRLPGKLQTPPPPRQSWCSGLTGPRRSEAGARGRGRPDPCCGPPAPAFPHPPGAPRGGRGRGGPEAWGTEGVGKAGDLVLWGWRLGSEGRKHVGELGAQDARVWPREPGPAGKRGPTARKGHLGRAKVPPEGQRAA